MGIELPGELRGLAQRTGARWPEADEDKMRESAQAWRDAAAAIDVLASHADGTAQGALGAIDGQTAQAARRAWEGFVNPDTGHLPISAKECTAAADRLEHAANQIGAGKVSMVRELVALGKKTDAAEQLAASGNRQALAGIPTLVSSTASNLANVHDTVATAVDAEGRSGVEQRVPSAVAAAGLSGATPPVAEQASDIPEQASDTAEAVAERVDGMGETTGVDRSAEAGTGPVSAETIAHAQSPLDDAGTGPLPVIDADADAASAATGSDTGPQAVHSAWAAPPVAPGAVAQGFATATPTPQTYAPQHYAQPSGYAPASGAPTNGAPRSATGSPAAPRSTTPPAAPPRHPAGPAVGSSAGAAPPGRVAQPAPRSAFRPGAAPVPPAQPAPAPAPGESHGDGQQRPVRQTERGSAVLAFVLHQFPIGYMPVAASKPSLQWSTPDRTDERAIRCFPPQDHPRSALVDDTDALMNPHTPTSSAGTEPSREVPEALLAGYDPLGPDSDLSEADWDRSYLRRAGSEDQRAQYVWPAHNGLPEGGLAPGEPVVLAAGMVVDHFGDSTGRVLSADGTPFAQRCLPPEHRERDYRRYRVLKPMPVWQATTASWFGQPGGGVRYRSTYGVGELVALGVLGELTTADPVTDDGTGSQEPTVRIESGRLEAEHGGQAASDPAASTDQALHQAAKS